MTDSNGDTLRYAYDKAGNLVRETDADGGITSYNYDLLGNVTNILSPDGTTTEYEYNEKGEVVSELVRNIAYNGEEDGENHYSNLANTSSKPFVATAIRYTEDAINANKGSGFAKPVPKTPTPAKPKVTPQEYAKARKQATTPTQAEYVQLRKSGINMSYGQYVNEKQQARFPSYGQYAYDKSIGKPTYQTFGAVQVVNHQSGTAYYKTPTVTAEATPKVESIVSSEYSCGRHSTVWELNAQAEIAKFQQQQYEGEAIIGALSGAINSFGRNIINAFAEISRLVRPSKTYNIDTNSKNWKNSLEIYTKGLAQNGIYNAYGIADTSYAVGQLLGDVASTVVEYIGLVKAAKGITSVISKLPEILSQLPSLVRKLLPAAGPAVETVISGAGTIAGASELSEGLALIGDALFNFNAFKNDWNTLKETNVPDYIKEDRVPIDKETILGSGDYKRTNMTNKGARVYEKDGMYYCRDTFHTGEAAHLEVFDRFGNHIGEANPLTGKIIQGTADASKHLYVR